MGGSRWTKKIERAESALAVRVKKELAARMAARKWALLSEKARVAVSLDGLGVFVAKRLIKGNMRQPFERLECEIHLKNQFRESTIAPPSLLVSNT